MANIKVRVEENHSPVVKVSRPSSTTIVAEDVVGPIEISDPRLAVSIIEGFMQIFRLGDLVDVDLSDLEDGSVLVYKANTDKWTATKVLSQQYINAGQF